MPSSATQRTQYAACACGGTVRIQGGQVAGVCGSCGTHVRAPAKRQKAPDVVLPRP